MLKKRVLLFCEKTHNGHNGQEKIMPFIVDDSILVKAEEIMEEFNREEKALEGQRYKKVAPLIEKEWQKEWCRLVRNRDGELARLMREIMRNAKYPI